MKLILIFALALCLDASAPSMAQDTPAPAVAAAPAAAISAEEQEYAGLVKLSYKMMTGFNFTRLRELYPHLSFFAPHNLNAEAVFDGFMGRVVQGDRRVADDATIFVKKNAALPQVHMLAAPLFRRLKMERTARYHEWMAGNLIAILAKSGDGAGPDTAYIPLTAEEEKLVTRDRGDIVSSRKVSRDGRTYNVVTVEMDQSMRRVETWFDTTAITDAAAQ